VIPLGFHVDYWDHQGWRDRFDSPAFSRRQEDYARKFHLESPYTPQMIVDGAFQFVGSSADRAKQSIAEAGADTAAARIDLTSPKGGNVAVKITSSNSANVMLAITEDNLATKVAAGENGGRTLHHSAVVRDLRQMGRVKDGAFSAIVPISAQREWKPDDLRVVVFVQDGESGKILGAVSRPFNSLSGTN
jgi:hypothetical protein